MSFKNVFEILALLKLLALGNEKKKAFSFCIFLIFFVTLQLTTYW